MSKLSDLAHDLFAKGYDNVFVSNYLKQYGYKDHEIQQAIAEAQFRHSTKVVPSVENKKSMVPAVFLVLIIAVGGFFAFNLLKTEALLDLELDTENFRYYGEEDVEFGIRVINLGSKDEFDVFLEYKVLDEVGALIFRSEESVAIATSIVRDKNIRAPEKPGRYTLNVNARYEDKLATASFTFLVEETPVVDIKPGDQVEPEYKFADIVDEIIELSPVQPSKAEELCLTLDEGKDDCLSMVVKESRRPEFCNNVDDDETRDNCYMSFIVEGQTYLCPRVVLQSNVDYCNRIKDIQILAKYYE